MDDRMILYNPRRQPVELHADGQVVVVAAGERVERVRSSQIDRLIAGGALQQVAPSPPDPPAATLVPSLATSPMSRRRHAPPRRPI